MLTDISSIDYINNRFLVSKLLYSIVPNESYTCHISIITELNKQITRWVLYTVQEMLTLPEHLISLPVFSGVRVVSYLLSITVDVNVLWFFESLFTLGFDCYCLVPYIGNKIIHFICFNCLFFVDVYYSFYLMTTIKLGSDATLKINFSNFKTVSCRDLPNNASNRYLIINQILIY